jgi:anti-sigma factor RsiW
MSNDSCSSKAKGHPHEHGVSCQGAYDLLFDLLDGQLPEEKAGAVQAHFQACPPCLQFLESYRKTPGLCREALAREVPQEVTSSLLSFLRSQLPK